MEAIFVFGFWVVGWLLDGKELYLYVVFFCVAMDSTEPTLNMTKCG